MAASAEDEAILDVRAHYVPCNAPLHGLKVGDRSRINNKKVLSICQWFHSSYLHRLEFLANPCGFKRKTAEFRCLQCGFSYRTQEGEVTQ
jgi:hypothetical protein